MIEVSIEAGVATHGLFSSIEIEILKGVAAGLQTKELASTLQRSTATIEHHIRTMCTRTGSVTRTQLVVKALAVGVITVSAEVTHRIAATYLVEYRDRDSA